MAVDRRPPRRLTERARSLVGGGGRPSLLDVAASVAVAVALLLGGSWLLGVFTWPVTLALALVTYGALAALVGMVALVAPRGSSDAPADERFVDLTASERVRVGTRRAGGGGSSVVVIEGPPPEAPTAEMVLEPEIVVFDDRPIRRRRFTLDALTAVVFAITGGAGFTLLLRLVLDMDGVLGTLLWWYLGFLAVYYLMVRDTSDVESAVDRMITLVIWSVGAAVTALLAWMLIFLFSKGLPKLQGGFFTQDMSKVGPLNPGGGVKHAIIGTLEQVGLATVFVVPIGILTAIYLHEIQGILTKPVRFIVDAMSGLPSIVAGLLVFSVWVNGHGFSGVAGSAALLVLMLPTVTRASEEILRTIPGSLREGALALGAPQWSVVSRVVVPAARAGLMTAVILGVARAVGETAPLLLTAFGADAVNTNVLKGPQSDLPLFVWKLIRLPNSTQVERAWSGLLVLVLLVLVLFIGARYASSRGQKRLGRTR